MKIIILSISLLFLIFCSEAAIVRQLSNHNSSSQQIIPHAIPQRNGSQRNLRRGVKILDERLLKRSKCSLPGFNRVDIEIRTEELLEKKENVLSQIESVKEHPLFQENYIEKSMAYNLPTIGLDSETGKWKIAKAIDSDFTEIEVFDLEEFLVELKRKGKK